ncbi:MAG: heavy metal-associated domain-containing protein [Verrucomicrobiales bacterium]
MRIAFMFLICLAGVALQAEEMKVRVYGFSHPERVEDFHKAVSTLPELTLVNVDGDRASATFRYDPPVLLGKAKPGPHEVTPEKILERINSLLGKASRQTFSVDAPSDLSEDKWVKVEIPVGVLDCKGCRYGAYIAIAKLEGVERASVNSDSLTLSVWIDPTKTNKEALEAALKKARVELPGHQS